MNADTLTYNHNFYPEEHISFFKNFIYKQDELTGIHHKNTYYIRQGQSGSKNEAIKQIVFTPHNTYTQSIFKEKPTVIKEIVLNKDNNRQADYIFFVFVFLLLLLSALFFFRRKKFSQLFRAFIIPRYVNQLVRDGNIHNEFFTYALLFLYFSAMALFVTMGLHLILSIPISVSHMAYIFIALIFIFIVKIFFIKTLQVVFQTKKETSDYIINNFLYLMLSAVVILPLTFVAYFTESPLKSIFFFVTLVIIGLLLIYRMIRNFIIGNASEQYRLYYFILYFCTVELLPLAIVVKLLINYFTKSYLIL